MTFIGKVMNEPLMRKESELWAFEWLRTGGERQMRVTRKLDEVFEFSARITEITASEGSEFVRKKALGHDDQVKTNVRHLVAVIVATSEYRIV